MYLNHFGLKREPFHITPDPQFLYLSPSHKEAVGSIIYGVKQRKGFIKVTGEPGTGKTTILRSYISEIKGERIHPLYLFVPGLRYKEILGMIIKGMKIEAEVRSTTDMLSAIHWGLIELYKKGHMLVLIIDEAQQMSIETLEQLRLLANLETTKEKLMQIVLCGQPEFDEMLQTPELRQLRQRIAVRAVINPLTRRESIEYIRYRVKEAGCEHNSLFTPTAEYKIAAYAKGCPRAINICCDNALVAAYADGADKVHSRLVKKVIHDLESDARPWRLPKREIAIAATFLALAGIFAGGVWVGRSSSVDAGVPAAVQPIERVSVSEPAFSLPDSSEPVAELLDEVVAVESGETAEAIEPAATELPTPAVAIWAAQSGETIEDVLIAIHGEATDELLAKTLALNPDVDAGQVLTDNQKIKIPEALISALTSESNTNGTAS